MTSPWAEVDAVKITFKHTALVIYAFLDIYGADDHWDGFREIKVNSHREQERDYQTFQEN